MCKTLIIKETSLYSNTIPKGSKTIKRNVSEMTFAIATDSKSHNSITENV